MQSHSFLLYRYVLKRHLLKFEGKHMFHYDTIVTMVTCI